MANVLNVYFNAELAGMLRDEKGRLFFQYAPAWLRSPNLVALSIPLPPSADEYGDDVVRPFFENLLPEGEIRSAIAHLKQVSEKNTLGLLEEIGGDCAGAISLLLPESAPPGSGDYDPLPDKQLNEMLHSLEKRPLITADNELRLSLAGAQQKLPVLLKDGAFFLGRGNAPSSHILKPNIAGFANTTANEMFCMTLADKAGLPVPKASLHRQPETVYLVERYDRVKVGERLTRLHQIDFCQALNLPSSKKYEKEGGPSLNDCFAILRNYCREPAKDVQNLISWTIFNYLIGNSDAHGKNLSLLMIPAGVELAPFYDLLCTAVYPGLTHNLAFKIGGENRPEWIQLRHWEKLADAAGVNKRYIASVCIELASRLPSIALDVEKSINFSNEEKILVEGILKTIADRSARLQRIFENNKDSR
jgi:serine/threonine-protein kinase HipA